MRNTLINWTPSWIPNWHAWKIAFEKAERVDEKIGLLRIGFHVNLDRVVYGEPDYASGDRIIHYLQIADGHCDSAYLSHKEDPDLAVDRPKRTPHGDISRYAQLRILVAQTAFDMLANNFFKSKWEPSTGLNDYNHPEWMSRLFETREVLHSVLHFFRIAPKSWSRDRAIINLPDHSYGGNKHNGEIAAKFLNDLFHVAWKFQCFGRYVETFDKLCRKELNAIKHCLVRRMVYSGKTDLLLRADFPIDERSLRMLEKLARMWRMDGYTMPLHDSERHRRAKTIEEAAADGSRPAQVYLLLQNKQRERVRLDEIRDTRSEAEKLARKLATLT